MHRKLLSIICFTLFLSLLISPLAGHTAGAVLAPSNHPGLLTASSKYLGIDEPDDNQWGYAPRYFETAASQLMDLAQLTLLSEGFSNEVFPPSGWTIYNLDGGEPNWERSMEDYFSSPASASHKFNVPPQISQIGWLVTPAVATPESLTILFSFNERTQRPQNYYKQEVHISSGDCTPEGGDFEFLVEVMGNDEWNQVEVDLSAYAGQTICLAFIYEGDQATLWFIDDILILASGYALALEAEEIAKTGLPGETVEYELTLTNTGSIPDTYDLSYGGSEWETSLSETEMTLDPGESAGFTASVTVPPDAQFGDWDAFIVEAVSQGEGMVSGEVELTTTAGAVYGLSLTADETEKTGLPGETVEYVLTLTNTGNITDTFDLSFSSAEWQVSLSQDQITLEAGASAGFTAQVSIPTEAGDGDVDSVLVTAASAGSPGEAADVLLTTTAVLSPIAGFEPSAFIVLVGEEITFTNTTVGSEPLTYLWDFGDGTFSTETDPTHTFNEEGQFTVSLTATNPFGESTFERVISVGNAPAAAFTASAEVVYVGERVNFTNGTAGTPPLHYTWDFGDGAQSSAINPHHTYTAPGLYTVSLQASNLYGEDEASLETWPSQFLWLAPTWRSAWISIPSLCGYNSLSR